MKRKTRKTPVEVRRRQAGVLLGMSAAVAAGPVKSSRAEKPLAAASATFSAEVLPDAETGWGIVVLRAREGAKRGLEVRVSPSAGSNLFSFQIDGVELLHQPEKMADLALQRSGTPVMFPTVNRVRDARMTFEGRAFVFEPNNGKNFIHGLARRRPFQVSALASKPGREATASTTLEWDDKQPEWARFPIKHRLTLGYTLRKQALLISYRVDNLDGARLPFGIGFHPYFRIPGPREDVVIKAPVDQRMEAVEYLPTGNLIAVEKGDAYDLRAGVPLAKLTLDDVFLGMTPKHAASFVYGKGGPRVSLGGSEPFTHLVVFTPPDKPFFCIENQTSSTDAHNLWERGKKAESHLLVIPPGGHHEGVVTWSVQR